jgi:prepilin-type N-terminal cleavage/methylation domain-containing protein
MPGASRPEEILHQARRSPQRGATLVELIVALVLLSIGAGSLAGGMRGAARSAAHGRALSIGAFAAESRLEELRARCGIAPGSVALGPVSEHWAVGARVGPLLQSLEVEDSVTILLSTGLSGRLVRSIARCTP